MTNFKPSTNNSKSWKGLYMHSFPLPSLGNEISTTNLSISSPWCSGYHYCTTSFNEAWTQVLRRFKSCSRRVGDSQWWGSLTMVPAGNKAKCLSSVNHTTKTIHQGLSHNIFANGERYYNSITNCVSKLIQKNWFETSSVTFIWILTIWREEMVWAGLKNSKTV